MLESKQVTYNVSTLKELKDKTKVKFGSKAWFYSKKALSTVAGSLAQLYLPCLGVVGDFYKKALWDNLLGDTLEKWVDKKPIPQDTKQAKIIKDSEVWANDLNTKFRGKDINNMYVAADLDTNLTEILSKCDTASDSALSKYAFVYYLDPDIKEYLKKNRNSTDSTQLLSPGDMLAHEEVSSSTTKIVVYLVDEILDNGSKVLLVNTETKSKVSISISQVSEDGPYLPVSPEDLDSIIVNSKNEYPEEVSKFISDYNDKVFTDSYGEAFIKIMCSDSKCVVAYMNTAKNSMILSFSLGQTIVCDEMRQTDMSHLYKIKGFKKGNVINVDTLEYLISDMKDTLLSQDGVVSNSLKEYLPSASRFTEPLLYFKALDKALNKCKKVPSPQLLEETVIPDSWKKDWEVYTNSEGNHEVIIDPPTKDYFDKDLKGAFGDLVDYLRQNKLSYAQGAKFVPSKYKSQWIKYYLAL